MDLKKRRCETLRYKPKSSTCNGCGKKRDPSKLKRTQGGYICEECMKENEEWADYMTGNDDEH